MPHIPGHRPYNPFSDYIPTKPTTLPTADSAVNIYQQSAENIPLALLNPPPKEPGAIRQAANWAFTPLVKESAVEWMPDWIEPVGKFATRMTSPAEIAFTVATLGVGAQLGFGIRGAAAVGKAAVAKTAPGPLKLLQYPVSWTGRLAANFIEPTLARPKPLSRAFVKGFEKRYGRTFGVTKTTRKNIGLRTRDELAMIGGSQFAIEEALERIPEDKRDNLGVQLGVVGLALLGGVGGLGVSRGLQAGGKAALQISPPKSADKAKKTPSSGFTTSDNFRVKDLYDFNKQKEALKTMRTDLSDPSTSSRINLLSRNILKRALSFGDIRTGINESSGLNDADILKDIDFSGSGGAFKKIMNNFHNMIHPESAQKDIYSAIGLAQKISLKQADKLALELNAYIKANLKDQELIWGKSDAETKLIRGEGSWLSEENISRWKKLGIDAEEEFGNVTNIFEKLTGAIRVDPATGKVTKDSPELGFKVLDRKTGQKIDLVKEKLITPAQIDHLNRWMENLEALEQAGKSIGLKQKYITSFDNDIVVRMQEHKDWRRLFPEGNEAIVKVFETSFSPGGYIPRVLAKYNPKTEQIERLGWVAGKLGALRVITNEVKIEPGLTNRYNMSRTYKSIQEIFADGYTLLSNHEIQGHFIMNRIRKIFYTVQNQQLESLGMQNKLGAKITGRYLDRQSVNLWEYLLKRQVPKGAWIAENNETILKGMTQDQKDKAYNDEMTRRAENQEKETWPPFFRQRWDEAKNWLQNIRLFKDNLDGLEKDKWLVTEEQQKIIRKIKIAKNQIKDITENRDAFEEEVARYESGEFEEEAIGYYESGAYYEEGGWHEGASRTVSDEEELGYRYSKFNQKRWEDDLAKLEKELLTANKEGTKYINFEQMLEEKGITEGLELFKKMIKDKHHSELMRFEEAWSPRDAGEVLRILPNKDELEVNKDILEIFKTSNPIALTMFVKMGQLVDHFGLPQKISKEISGDITDKYIFDNIPVLSEAKNEIQRQYFDMMRLKESDNLTPAQKNAIVKYWENMKPEKMRELFNLIDDTIREDVSRFSTKTRNEIVKRENDIKQIITNIIKDFPDRYIKDISGYKIRFIQGGRREPSETVETLGHTTVETGLVDRGATAKELLVNIDRIEAIYKAPFEDFLTSHYTHYPNNIQDGYYFKNLNQYVNYVIAHEIGHLILKPGFDETGKRIEGQIRAWRGMNKFVHPDPNIGEQEAFKAGDLIDKWKYEDFHFGQITEHNFLQEHRTNRFAETLLDKMGIKKKHDNASIFAIDLDSPNWAKSIVTLAENNPDDIYINPGGDELLKNLQPLDSLQGTSRLMISGSRFLQDRKFIEKIIDLHIQKYGIPEVIIHGGAKGADFNVGEIAKKKGINIIEEPVSDREWDILGYEAGPLRNQAMIDKHSPTHFIALPGGFGTGDALTKAMKADLEIWNFHRFLNQADKTQVNIKDADLEYDKLNKGLPDFTSAPIKNINKFRGDLTSPKDRPEMDAIYVFGDNLLKLGKKGQSEIRDLTDRWDRKTAFGIPTKKKPATDVDSYFNFTEKDFEEGKNAIDSAINEIVKVAKEQAKPIYIPWSDTPLTVGRREYPDGRWNLGTGLAELDKRAPKLFNYLQDRLDSLVSQESPVKLPDNIISIPSRDMTAERFPGEIIPETWEEYHQRVMKFFDDNLKDISVLERKIWMPVINTKDDGKIIPAMLSGYKLPQGMDLGYDLDHRINFNAEKFFNSPSFVSPVLDPIRRLGQYSSDFYFELMVKDDRYKDLNLWAEQGKYGEGWRNFIRHSWAKIPQGKAAGRELKHFLLRNDIAYKLENFFLGASKAERIVKDPVVDSRKIKGLKESFYQPNFPDNISQLQMERIKNIELTPTEISGGILSELSKMSGELDKYKNDMFRMEVIDDPNNISETAFNRGLFGDSFENVNRANYDIHPSMMLGDKQWHLSITSIWDDILSRLNGFSKNIEYTMEREKALDKVLNELEKDLSATTVAFNNASGRQIDIESKTIGNNQSFLSLARMGELEFTSIPEFRNIYWGAKTNPDGSIDESNALAFESHKEFMSDMDKQFAAKLTSINVLKKIESLNKFQRVIALGFDGSVFSIQLLAMWFYHPEIAAGSAAVYGKTLYKAFADPEAVQLLKRRRNEDPTLLAYRRMFDDRILISSRGEGYEITEAFADDGVITKYSQKLGAGRLANAFKESLEATLDYAGDELAVSLAPGLEKTARTTFFINHQQTNMPIQVPEEFNIYITQDLRNIAGSTSAEHRLANQETVLLENKVFQEWARSKNILRKDQFDKINSGRAIEVTNQVTKKKTYDPRAVKELAEFINYIRGLSSSADLGISADQRLIESIVLLAPRYRRAVAGLYAKLFSKDDFTRLEAQKAIGRFVGGITLTVMSLQMMHSAYQGDTEEEMLEKLGNIIDPSNKDFMMFNIAGQRIGIGSKIISDARIASKGMNYLWKKGTNEDLEDWEDFIGRSKNNPTLQWVRAQMAAVPSESIDMMLGSDFIGQPSYTGTNSLEFFQNSARPIAENIVPLWLWSGLIEGNGTSLDWKEDVRGRGARMAGDYIGLRAYPQGPSTILREAAYDVYKMTYDKLEPFQKHLLKHITQAKLNKVREENNKKVMNEFDIYFAHKDLIEEEYISSIEDLLKVYPDTKRGNSDMRYRWEMLRSVKRGQENQIGLYMDWGENDTTHEDPKKRALALYFALFDEPGLKYPDTDIINWDRYNVALEKLKEELGPELTAVIERNQNLDPLPDEFIKRMAKIGKARHWKNWMKAEDAREEYLTGLGFPELAEVQKHYYRMLKD